MKRCRDLLADTVSLVLQMFVWFRPQQVKHTVIAIVLSRVNEGCDLKMIIW